MPKINLFKLKVLQKRFTGFGCVSFTQILSWTVFSGLRPSFSIRFDHLLIIWPSTFIFLISHALLSTFHFPKRPPEHAHWHLNMVFYALGMAIKYDFRHFLRDYLELFFKPKINFKKNNFEQAIFESGSIRVQNTLVIRCRVSNTVFPHLNTVS